jgi:hypothetical protein
MLHTHLYLRDALIKKTSRQTLESSKTNVISETEEALDIKALSRSI